MSSDCDTVTRVFQRAMHAPPFHMQLYHQISPTEVSRSAACFPPISCAIQAALFLRKMALIDVAS